MTPQTLDAYLAVLLRLLGFFLGAALGYFEFILSVDPESPRIWVVAIAVGLLGPVIAPTIAATVEALGRK